jgi:hypothetical protein
MARGYLGKISAIVSANTGDYVRKLDDSAKRTAAFARTIQNDLNRASRDASKSIDSILTPLQRFERAIQNAAGARLKFRGVDVAVRTIDDLRRSLASLESESDRQVAVRVSGLRNITELKQALTGIREEDIDLAVNVGGVEGLRRLRSEVQEINGQQVNIRTERTAEQLDVLIEKFSRISPERIRQIAVRVESRQLDAAIAKERQLFSLSREIAGPLADAAAQFDKLSLEVQSQFVPALSAAQNKVLGVSDRIEAGGQIGQRAFRRIADEVRLTTDAIESLAEAQGLVQSIGTGRTLRDTSPRQFDAFTRATRQTQESSEVSAQTASQFGLGDRQRRVFEAASRVQEISARRQSQELELQKAQRSGNAAEEQRLQRQLQLTIQYEAKKTAELERQLTAQKRQVEAAKAADAARQEAGLAAERDQQAAAEEAAADRSRRVEVASAFLPPVITLPDPTAERTAQLQGISDRLGPDIASSAAEFARLEAATVQVKNQIDQLPAGVRARFIPAIRDAVDELLRLAATDASPEELERATQRVVQLRQEVTRTAQAATQLRSIGDALEQIGTAEAVGQLSAAARVLAQIGATAGGPAAIAYEQLRQAQQRFIDDGTTGTPAARQEIERLQRALAQAAAASGKISFSRALREIQRGGSIAAKSFNNVGIAAQQAIFIFDDFFSVTGDISQRLRAIGNNISQLGFILGGTEGLFAGVAISLAAQGVAALVRWATSADVAKASTEALNDALRNQQNAVSSLADAYAKLAREIAKAGATGFQRRAADREDRIRELRQLAQERQRETVANLSPEVAELRGRRGILQETLEGTSNLERRLQIQAEIDRNRRQEQAATARGVRAPDASQVRDQLIAAEEERVRQTRVRLNRAQLRDRLGGDVPAGEEVDTIRAELVARQADLARRVAAVAAAGRAEQLQQLRGSRSDLEAQRDRVVASGARTTEIDAAIDQVTIAIQRIEANLAPAVQRVVEQITRQSLSIAATLEESGQIIAGSLGDSAEARELRRAIADTASEISRLQQAAGEAATPEEAERIRGQIGAARRRADALRSRAQGVAFDAAVDPQFLFGSAADRARQNLSESGASRGRLARELRQLEARRSQLVQDLDAENPFARRRAEVGLEELDDQVRAIEGATFALRAFTEAIGRAEDGVNSRLQQAQQQLDSVIERDIAFSTPQSRRDVERAREDRDRQRRSAANAQAELASQRARAEEDIRRNLPDVFEEQQAILEQLSSGSVSARTEAVLRQRLAEIDGLTEPFRRSAEAAAEAATRQDIFERQRPLLEAAGQQFLQSPGQRAAEQLARDLEGIRLAAARTAEETTGLIDEAAVGEARQRAFRQAAEQVAPLAVGFSDEVANALLQGPSRAALQASDASTLQGQQELNRLLRGEDPARDVNLVELQKQTRELERLVQLAEQGPPVAQ